MNQMPADPFSTRDLMVRGQGFLDGALTERRMIGRACLYVALLLIALGVVLFLILGERVPYVSVSVLGSGVGNLGTGLWLLYLHPDSDAQL